MNPWPSRCKRDDLPLIYEPAAAGCGILFFRGFHIVVTDPVPARQMRDRDQQFLRTMPKLIIEPKKAKDGQIEYIVNYHDPKSDNSFTITTTNNLDEAVERLKSTLASEVAAMLQKK